MHDGKLVLEDGSVFAGMVFGALEETAGEIVFNTSMSGYQEILTDPSYKGEIVTMTYPLIGNYGINPDDFESKIPQVNGFIVKEFCQQPANWRYRLKLNEYLAGNGITAIAGIDTRALTRLLRKRGTMKGIITMADDSPASLADKAAGIESLSSRDLVSEVTPLKVKKYGSEQSLRVVLVDCGAKKNIINSLLERNCQVVVVPANTSSRQILALQPAGIILSNGPGDPQCVPYLVETVRELLGKRPLFGICLGHQILGLACGAETFKLKFGHRGANHPVKDLKSGRVYITSQNHGFAIKQDSISGLDLEVSHLNVNDGTVEGIRHTKHPAFSVQYHPEASPGPEDSHYLFDQFINMISD